MNLHDPNREQFDVPPEVEVVDEFHAEQILIGHAMADSSKVAEVRAKLTDAEFAHPRNAEIWNLICSICDEGKTPGLQTILGRIGHDAEIEPGLRAHDYLLKCARSAVTQGGLWLPISDCVDAMRDRSHRGLIAHVGSSLSASMTFSSMDLSDVVGDAISQLDDVASSLRSGRLLHYSAGDAGLAAIEQAQAGVSNNPSTGILDLDRITGGWPRGLLTIVAARPGMGKSALALSAMRASAKSGHAHLMFSLEMTKPQVGGRLLTDAAYSQQDTIHYDSLWLADVPDRHIDRLKDAQREIDGLSIQIEEQRGLTLSDIAARTRKLANELARHGQHLDVVTVDHIGLIQASSRYAGNRVREMAEISNGLATLAKELDIAVVGLCQLNRGVEGRDNKRPGMSDLRDSGAIEEDARLIIFPYRPAYYIERMTCDEPEKEMERKAVLEAKKNILELAISKNSNGRVDTVNVFCDIGANAIRDMRFAT